MLASCNKQEAMLSNEELKTLDSLALKVAVMPVMDCLPVYYAQRTGLMKEMDLNVSLKEFNAQMDIDTAIVNGSVEVAYTDLIRMVRLTKDAKGIQAIMQAQGAYSLIAIKGKRVSKLNQMKERMIGITRLSATDYWCDELIDRNKSLTENDIYRPQINDVQLRAEMLKTGLIDAAIVPEPYATWMKILGNKILFESDKKAPLLGTWVVTDHRQIGKRKHDQVKKFVEAYNQAVEDMNNGVMTDTIKAILHQTYRIPKAICDTMRLEKMVPATLPSAKDLETACNFLKKRERMPEGLKTDSLIEKRFIPQKKEE